VLGEDGVVQGTTKAVASTEPLAWISGSRNRPRDVPGAGVPLPVKALMEVRTLSGFSGLRLADDTELPSFLEAASLEGQFIQTAEDKAMTGIEVREPATVGDIETVFE